MEVKVKAASKPAESANKDTESKKANAPEPTKATKPVASEESKGATAAPRKAEPAKADAHASNQAPAKPAPAVVGNAAPSTTAPAKNDQKPAEKVPAQTKPAEAAPAKQEEQHTNAKAQPSAKPVSAEVSQKTNSAAPHPSPSAPA